MSKAGDTKDHIVERSATIFNIKGYAGTSLSDLVAATGLTKGAIYGNFESKDGLAVAAYKHNVAMLNKRLDEAINHHQSAYDKLLAFTGYYRQHWKKMFERGGCPILNASVEADDNLPVLKKHVQQSIRHWAARVAGLIEEGQESGELRKKVSADEYAYAIITLIEGGIMVSKIMGDQRLLMSALDRIDHLIRKELRK